VNAVFIPRKTLRDYERAIAVASLEIESLARVIERKREAGEDISLDEQVLDRMLEVQAERIAARIEIIANG
jgi:hypothetical protein